MLPTIVFGQTTEDEFNYATKGYQSQIEAGLDPVKKNYKVVDIPVFHYTNNGINYEFKKLIKGEDSLKCIIMIMHRKNAPNYYCCLPHPLTNNDLWLKCMAHINVPITETFYASAKFADLAGALLRMMNYFAY